MRTLHAGVGHWRCFGCQRGLVLRSQLLEFGYRHSRVIDQSLLRSSQRLLALVAASSVMSFVDRDEAGRRDRLVILRNGLKHISKIE